MIATVSRPATIELTTSCCPGRKSDRPNVPRMRRSRDLRARAMAEHAATRVPRKRDRGSVMLRERFATAGNQPADGNEEQSRDDRRHDEPDGEQDRREGGTLKQSERHQREQ